MCRCRPELFTVQAADAVKKKQSQGTEGRGGNEEAPSSTVLKPPSLRFERDQGLAAFVVVVAGELVAFQAAGAKECDALRFVAAGGGAEQLRKRGAELREGEGGDRFFSPLSTRS